MKSVANEQWFTSFEKTLIQSSTLVIDSDTEYRIEPQPIPIAVIRVLFGIVAILGIVSAFFFPNRNVVTLLLKIAAVMVGCVGMVAIFEAITKNNDRHGSWFSLDKLKRSLSLASHDVEIEATSIVAIGEILARNHNGFKLLLTCILIETDEGLISRPVFAETCGSARSKKWPDNRKETCGQKLSRFFEVPLQKISAMDLSQDEARIKLGIL